MDCELVNVLCYNLQWSCTTVFSLLFLYYYRTHLDGRQDLCFTTGAWPPSSSLPSLHIEDAGYGVAPALDYCNPETGFSSAAHLKEGLTIYIIQLKFCRQQSWHQCLMALDCIPINPQIIFMVHVFWRYFVTHCLLFFTFKCHELPIKVDLGRNKISGIDWTVFRRLNPS